MALTGEEVEQMMGLVGEFAQQPLTSQEMKLEVALFELRLLSELGKISVKNTISEDQLGDLASLIQQTGVIEKAPNFRIKGKAKEISDLFKT